MWNILYFWGILNNELLFMNEGEALQLGSLSPEDAMPPCLAMWGYDMRLEAAICFEFRIPRALSIFQPTS